MKYNIRFCDLRIQKIESEEEWEQICKSNWYKMNVTDTVGNWDGIGLYKVAFTLMNGHITFLQKCTDDEIKKFRSEAEKILSFLS